MKKIISSFVTLFFLVSISFFLLNSSEDKFNLKISTFNLNESTHTLKIAANLLDAKLFMREKSQLYFLTPDNKEINIPLEGELKASGSNLYINLPYLFPGKYLYKNKEFSFYIVTNKYSKINKISDCSGVNDNYQCYFDLYKKILFYDNNPKKYIKLISESKNPEIAALCHTLTHYLGREEILINPNIAKAELAGSKSCLDGYEHGILEGYALRVDGKRLGDEFSKICDNKYSLEGQSCEHTLGHLAYFRTGSLNEALKYCTSLIKVDERAAAGCSDGVTMSYLLDYNDNRDLAELFPKIDNIFSFCKSYKEEILIAGCYGQLNFFYTGILKESTYDEVAKGCSEILDSPVAVSGCYTSFGRLLASSNRDVSKVFNLCSTLVTSNLVRQLDNCVVGAAIYISTSYPLGKSYYSNICSYIKDIDVDEKTCLRLKPFFT